MKATLESDIKVVEKEATDLVTKVNGLTITNQLEYEGAAEFLKHIKEQEKKVEKSFDAIISKAYQTHKEAVAQKNKFFNPLAAAEKVVKNLMSAYQNKKEAEAKEAQRKLQEAADREAKRKQDALDAQIAKAKEAGNEAKVEKLEEKKENIISAVVPIVSANISKPEGVSYRDNWTAEVTAVNLLDKQYMIPNMPMLNGLAKSTKGTLKIDGVKWKVEKVLASRL